MKEIQHSKVNLSAGNSTVNGDSNRSNSVSAKDEELVFLPAYQLAQLIRDRQVSCQDLIKAHLAQIARHNQTLNAIVTLDEEGAQKQAKAADEALAKGNSWGALHGVPITIKDCLETKGIRTTSSYQPLADYIPEQDATAVARLRAAGAIVLGKTNTPKLAEDFQTNSPLFGRTNNPWNLEYTPGGSTGGGAAAVAAGLSPLELGSDCGGSIRIPSHFCGLFGLKPTEQRVSFFGHIPELPRQPKSIRHLQTVGPLARSVEDLRLCLSLIEDKDVTHSEVLEKLPNKLESYRFAWTDSFGDIPPDAETRAAMEKLASYLTEIGCYLEQQSPPNFDFIAVWEAYISIFQWEFDALQLDKSVIQQQRYVQALAQRNTFINQIERFLNNWDGLLVPVAPTPAFPHCPMGKPIEVDGQQFSYMMSIGAYTTPFNLTGNPAVVMPFTRSKKGLPMGIQIVGRRGSDMKLLGIAEKLTQVTGLFQRPPGY
ncbi:MAG: amidase [Moorea sp. SIO2I5]|nr:amidase [Moorena sp. SIO2I5]